MTTSSQGARVLIGGEERPGIDGGEFQSVDPATGEVLGTLVACTERDVDLAVGAARTAVDRDSDWQVPRHRVIVLNRMAALIRERAEELAVLESRDTGKPLSQARADVTGAARYFEFYAGFADKLDGRSIPVGPDFIDFTVREPYGVVAVITAWNYPIQIASRSVAPALAAGNALVVKPAPEAPLSTLELGRIAQEAGVPAGYLNVITGGGPEVGMPLAIHPDVDLVAFTGSRDVGKLLGSAAAQLIRPFSLELGGKSPNVLFEDADLAKAIPAVVSAIAQNAGQNCAAGSRLLVHRSIHDEVVAAVGERLASLQCGHGIGDPDLGPLITQRQHAKVAGMVEEAVAAGARVVVGGASPEGDEFSGGHFYLPTLLSEVDPKMAIAREEVFGPVLVAIPFDSDADAVRIANDTTYGLTSAVWTADVARGHRIARRLQSGQVYINTFGVGGGGSAELPFGGYRQSGHGRTKGLEGLLEFTQIKNVCVAL
ncbi:aldehyde dehydrogenase family protein [Actinomadura macra]|uniref:aldehyde dehydrogenase family protein n=1 Tax=Actinomadura macra TaxID=46164 RepID=UPI000AC4EE35|nr:aldehyde dehydrogenase family protein [Actinomadura macra]